MALACASSFRWTRQQILLSFRVEVFSTASLCLPCFKGGSLLSTRHVPWSAAASRGSRGAADELMGATTDEDEEGAQDFSDTEESTSSRKRVRRSSKKTRPKSPMKSKQEESQNKEDEEEDTDGDEEDYDWPPLVCCFGEAINEFIPSVRVSKEQEHPDIYSTWKLMQWRPPEFARAPGGPSFNVAIALARLGGRVVFMGKVGDDAYGRELVLTLNQNGVQTRGIHFDSSVQTGLCHLDISYEDGNVKMTCAQPSAENSLLQSEINVDILKEARMFHFTSTALTLEPMRSSLLSALKLSKSYGGCIFFDLNLPLPLWMSREQTWDIIGTAWSEANVIELTKHELEFLIGEGRFRNKVPQYTASSLRELSHRRDEYHYKIEEIASIWHPNLKMLLVTDGTYLIHYYTPTFDGEVLGVEDVIVAAYTCDRSGSGDAMVAAIMRKLSSQPALFDDEEMLPKALRFAVCAGIIAQWTTGSTRGLPTESAAQNLTEQIFRPVFVQPLQK